VSKWRVFRGLASVRPIKTGTIFMFHVLKSIFIIFSWVKFPKIFVFDISKMYSGISEYDFDIFLLGKLSSRNFLTRFSSKNLFSDFSSLALRHLMTNSIFWPHLDSEESDFLTEKAFINLLHHIYDRFNSIQSSFRNQYWFYFLTNWPHEIF